MSEVLPEIEPSVTDTVGLSALYSFSEPPADEMPFVNVIVVAVPKFTAAAVLSVAVGVVAGFVELFAPLNVRLWSPA